MRRRKKRLQVLPKTLLRICLFFCVVMLFISFRYSQAVNPAKTALGGLITPMQKGINTVGSYITSKFDLLHDMNELTQKKEQLEQELERLKLTASTLTTDLYELNNLRALYRVGERYADYPKVAARVISKEPNSYYSIFTIDKGANDGIMVDMNILAGNGLCGIVIEVGENHAKIRSIIDDDSYVSGMFPATSDTCDVKGSLELLDSGYIHVEAISIHADIKEDYEVVTSHISDKFLPGILIGHISNIEMDSSNLAKKAYLRPAADFEHLEEVLVITQLKEPLKPLPDENSPEIILNRASQLSDSDKKYLISELQKQTGEVEP